MKESNEALPDVIWLGERSEYVTTDFDGRVRRGTVLGTLRPVKETPDGPPGPTYVRLRLDPPLPWEGAEHDEVVIDAYARREGHTDVPSITRKTSGRSASGSR